MGPSSDAVVSAAFVISTATINIVMVIKATRREQEQMIRVRVDCIVMPSRNLSTANIINSQLSAAMEGRP